MHNLNERYKIFSQSARLPIFASRLYLLFLLFLVLTFSCSEFVAADSGLQTFTLEHDNLERTYYVYTPASGKSMRQLPVLLVLHGGGGNAEDMAEYSGILPYAEVNKFIAVFPEGVGKSLLGNKFAVWNAGVCCGKDKPADDVGFIEKVIVQTTKQLPVDKKRIYVTGMSNGAMMSYRLACELSDKITAIAPIGAVMTFTEATSCNPKRPVPILHIHGAKDPCALYSGGQCGGCFARVLGFLGRFMEKDTWPCPAVPDYISSWAVKYGADKGTAYEPQEKVSCQPYLKNNTALVTLCTVSDMWHVWPGSSFRSACSERPHGYSCRALERELGPLYPDFDGNKFIWSFLSKQSL